MENELTIIKKASFWKRIVALIMDGAVAIFGFFAFFVLVFSPISTKAFKYNDLVDEGNALRLASHLYVEEDENTNYPLTEYNDKEVSFYLDRIKDYYLEFKVEKASDKDVLIKDENGNEVLPKDYYTEDWFNTKFASVTTVDAAKNASLDALVDFSKYIAPISYKIKQAELVMIFPSFFLSYGIFFIMFPLIFKNGETLGKKVMQVGLISNEGYAVKKRQIILRQIFLLIMTFLAAFTITIGIFSFAFLGLGVFIYYLAAFISKPNRSVADYLAYTYMIDTKNSVWFKSAKDEERRKQIIDENIEKLNKQKDKNKNILQVGSEIVNEEAKREILESTGDKKDA